MHLFIGTRGIIDASAKFIRQLSSKYVTMPVFNKKTGEKQEIFSQIHVRPIQLWEIVFPKERQDIVLSTIFPNGVTGPDHPWFGRIYNFISKFMPIKPLPKVWDTSKKLLVADEGVERMGFGIKEDRINDFQRSKEDLIKLGLDPNVEWECEAL